MLPGKRPRDHVGCLEILNGFEYRIYKTRRIIRIFMPKLSFSGIRARLILLVLLVIVPLTLFFYFHARGMRHHAVERARGDASSLMKIAVLREEEILRETRQILSTLAEIPVVVQGGKGCNEFLARFRGIHPRFLNFSVTRSDGLVIGSAIPFKKPVSASERLYFQETLKNRSFTVGQYQVGFITGKPSINFGYPVFDTEGKVSAVVIAALDLSSVTNFEYEIDIRVPANSTFIKLDRNGTVLTSYPAAQLFGRGNPLEKSLFEKISKEKKGTFEAVGADGVERLYLFSAFGSTLHKGDSYVLLGVPTSALFAESDGELLRNLSILFVVTLLSLMLTWFGGGFLIVRPVRTLVDASKRLAAGDFTARSGLPPTYGELGELGRVFDEMAGELERGQDESRRILEVSVEKQELGNRLISLINNVPGMVYRGHRDWSLSFIGAEVKPFTGYTAEEFTSGAVNWKTIVHPEDLGSVKEIFREAARTGEKTLRVEYRIRHKDSGSERWVEDRRQIIYDDRGEFFYVDGLLLDITDRKRHEETLRKANTDAQEERAKSDAIIAAIGDGISIQDRNFRILYQNEVHKNLVGDHVGRFCYEVYENKDHRCEVCPIAMAYRDGGIHTVEKRVLNGMQY